MCKNLFLNHQWSSEQISERLKMKNFNYAIIDNTFYRWIYEALFDETGLSRGNWGSIRKLGNKGKNSHTNNYKERRGKIVKSYLITERPQIANYRGRIWDWETDTASR